MDGLSDPAMKARRAFGIRWHGGTTFSNSFEMIRDKVAAKSSQHGDLGLPLIVFVAFHDTGTIPSRDELESAFYGRTRETIYP